MNPRWDDLCHTVSAMSMRKIPIEGILERSESGQKLVRRLKARDLVGFGVGIIIGTGIFTITGIQAKENAGPGVVLSFVIGGVVAMLAALCYAELASSVPTAGSAYTYAFATLGETFAWIIGWDLLLEFVLGAAVVSRSWSGYVGKLLHLPPSLFGEKSVVNVGAVLIIAVLAVVAVIGIRESAWVTNLLVAVKVAVCVAVIVIGAFFFQAANLIPFVPPSVPAAEGTADLLHQPLIQAAFGLGQSTFGLGGVLAAAAIVFFSYTGFEAVANLGEETRRPRRDLPIGVLGSLILCTFLYVAVSLVLTAMVNYRQIDSDAPLATAFMTVGLPWVGVIIGLGAMTGLTSVMMVELVTIGRIGFAMGRDGLLPRKLGEAHPKFGTPHRFTIIGAIVIAILAAFVPLEELQAMVSIGALSAFVVVAIAIPVLRRTRPDLERPFKVPFSPVLPIITALACFYLMANLDIMTWIRFAVWLAVGLAIYFAYGRRHSFLNTKTAKPAKQSVSAGDESR